MGIVDAFKQSIYPVMVEIGSVVAVTSIITTAYKIMRVSNWQQVITRLKDIGVAYVIIKFAFAILAFIDKLVLNIQI